MPYSKPIVLKLLQRLDAYIKVFFYKCLCYQHIAFLCFYTFGYHGLIAYQKQCTSWYFIKKTYGKNGSGFHIYGIGPYFLQVFL